MPDGPRPPFSPFARRRFLRESFRGTVPLLLQWTRGGPKRHPDVSSADQDAPDRAREELDRLQEEFVRDNGDLTRSLMAPAAENESDD